MATKYYASFNEDLFDIGPFVCRQSAILAINTNNFDDCEEHNEDRSFWVGEAIPFQPEVCATSVCEQLEEEAYEHAGEYSQSWDLKPDKQLQADLNKAVTDYLKRSNNEPTFFQIDAVTEHLRQPVKCR